MTRISLALAFARIFPPGERTRAYAIGLAIFFAMLFVSVVVPGTISCSKRSSWLFHAGIVVQCDFSTRFIIYFIAGMMKISFHSPHAQQYWILANVVGDLLLVCSPIYKLRRVKLPQSQRRLIFTCIAGSTFMSLSCFATSAFQIGPVSWEPGRGFIRILLGYFEVRQRNSYITLSSLTTSILKGGISLTICNLLVVVTYFYTVTHKQSTVPQVSVEEPKTSPIIPTMTRPSSQPVVVSHNPSMGSVITPLTLTEISGAYLTRTDTASEGS